MAGLSKAPFVVSLSNHAFCGEQDCRELSIFRKGVAQLPWPTREEAAVRYR